MIVETARGIEFGTVMSGVREVDGQILYQLPEINPPVRGKVEQYFIIVKGIFRVNQRRREGN